MVRYAIGLVALLTVFSSCEPKVNLTGKYEEKALIYGLLDPRDNPSAGGTGHLFRIQKAFLGEESAFVMAQNPDSSYFKYEDLFVELVEYAGTNESNRWVLDTIIISNKDTGDPSDNEIDFFGPTQRLYKAAVNINADRDYEITLKKRPASIGTPTIANMDTVTPFADSKISIIDESTFRFENPSENLANAGAQKMTLVNTSGEFIQYNIKFRQAANVGQYEVWLRFHYREVINNIETPKTIEWLARSIEINSENEGQAVLQNPIVGQEIYSRIGSEIPVDAGVTRKIGKADGAPGDPWPNDGHTQDFDIIVRMGGEELFNYIDINDPNNSGVLQDKPVYTNINNGLGVFSSRTEIDFTNLIYMSTESYNELIDGQYTSGRGFVVDPN
ncbi:MAG: hypothetical protein H6601_06195 [Flavobacteriales bacterium]|nr:hypothetical protein [Flavobacteriales bacterium]